MGVYDFAYRFSRDAGESWIYCDGSDTVPYDGYNHILSGLLTVADSGCVPDPEGYQCTDCVDNDGDGLIDGFDPTCFSSIDRLEGSYETGIPGDDVAA